MTLHNQGFSQCYGDTGKDSDAFNFEVEDLFPSLFESVAKTSLDGLDDHEHVQTTVSMTVQTMEMKSFKLMKKKGKLKK